jgi:hypothetical protein
MKNLWFLPVLAAIGLTVFYYHQWQHWLAFETGSYNTPGVAHNYNFTSGFGSDLGEYTIAVGLITNFIILWRAHTCHGTWWCWHHGHYNLEGTPYKLCTKHHPADVPTVKEAITSFINGGSK